MPTITFNEWGFGLDLRKGASTSDANRLRVLKNAYVTDGKTIRKRPGCLKVMDLEAGTVGLFAGLGQLNTFQANDETLVAHPGALIVNHGLTPESAGAGIANVNYCDTFNGFLYLVASHEAIPFVTYRHHYLDGTADTRVTDVNCPQTRPVTKAASKMWAADGDVVRFCKTNDPRDWTTASDAGFLPVGLQQSGSRDTAALGNYQNRLVVFFPDSAQVWQVDPDPANHEFLQSVDIGTALPYAHQNMSGDVFYFSPAGVRTITRQSNTENLIDADVGSPIDRELLKGEITGELFSYSFARAKYFRGAGQYWLYQGNTAAVFTFSRTAKISAWSVYTFPFELDHITELDTDLYIRSGDSVYVMDRDTWTDDGTEYQVEIETAYADFKSPGVLKQILAMDAVTTGSGDFSCRFDPRNTDLETSPPVTISGDTRPGNLYPVELMTTSLSTVVRNLDDAEFELHSFSYLFEALGSV